MFVERFKSKIVSHFSYFIGSKGDAVVVDPERNCSIYLKTAQRENMNIRYIFETHRHEDFVVGSRELAHLSGAEVYHGSWPDFTYGNVLRDNQEFRVGDVMVTAIHTPGHTPGCMSYIVADLESGYEAVLVCTGDALFVNDVGRTDFGGPDKRREWSESLFMSIVGRILPLGDHVILCPAHGSGSVCGSNIASREWSTLGIERLMNPVLRLSKEEFIEYKVNERHEYAPYFRLMEHYNIEGAPFLGAGQNCKAFSAEEFRSQMDSGAVILDVRSPSAFGGAHIPSSYNIPVDVLSFAGWFLPFDKPVLAVTNDVDDLEYVSKSLASIGYDNVVGYLGGGLSSWYSIGYPIESLRLVVFSQLKSWLDSGKEYFLLDVRSKDEYEEGHIKFAKNIYVGLLQERIKEIPKDLPIVVICGSGTRASIGASILLRNGYKRVYNFLGAMRSWKELGYPLSK
ncbi:MAG: Metallo-beta-lactamase [Thermoproteota archaeon]|nr:Metallo-beta-lactamase [Thermoproteota archaeon]